jgi:D-beta-D-heptose 7-phosphate kinase/D-beta-D-heptose 1-phosphate adenosyltransferase
MKIVTPNQFNKVYNELWEEWPETKKVFTNGCFDIMHVGHVHLLREAKSFGDLLVVGLNSDSSVQQIKGPKRPVIPQSERAEVLAAIEYVNYIIMFDTPTPLPLIKRIEPHIIVKGEDWRGKHVVGSELVDNVKLVNFKNGTSTSHIIERIIWRFER